MDTIEQSRLIDAFMGGQSWKITAAVIQEGEDEGKIFLTDDELVKYLRGLTESGDPELSDHFIVDEAYAQGYVDDMFYTPYQDDWSLLMPVVDKINRFDEGYENLVDIIHQCVMQVHIGGAFTHIVEFIKSYNEENK